MAKIFVKSEDELEDLKVYLESYIRKLTVHNVAVFEKNADLCVSLVAQKDLQDSLPFTYGKGELETRAGNNILKQFKEAGVSAKMHMKKTIDELECPTIFVNVSRCGKPVDAEIYGTIIGQALILTFAPDTKLDPVSIKDAKDKPVKRSSDKSYMDRKFVQEPTSNAKLLFKKN